MPNMLMVDVLIFNMGKKRADRVKKGEFIIWNNQVAELIDAEFVDLIKDGLKVTLRFNNYNGKDDRDLILSRQYEFDVIEVLPEASK